jgi:hypothetical protein
MPEWRKMREAITAGASSTQELAIIFDVGVGSISHTFRQMPDGEEQKARMKTNRTGSPSAPLDPGLPAEIVDMLLAQKDHYDESPAPRALTSLVAKLLRAGVSGRPIAGLTDRPLYVIEGWAAQGGYITEPIVTRHNEIREAIAAGAESLQDVADLLGLTRERVRQLTYSMPDIERVYLALHVKLRRKVDEPSPQQLTIPEPIVPDRVVPKPKPEPKPKRRGRELTDQERAKLIGLVERVQALPRFAPPGARKIIIERDMYTRQLFEDDVSAETLAKAVGMSPNTIRDWTSPAKQYRRQLHNQVAQTNRGKPARAKRR